MNVILDLYVNNDDKQVLEKTLENEKIIQGEFIETTDMLSPSIIIYPERTDDFFSYCNYNYARIEELGRYYYINNVEFLTGSQIRLNLKIDVLNTWCDSLLNCPCIVSRNEFANDRKLEDKEMGYYYNKSIEINEITNGFTGTYAFEMGNVNENTHHYAVTVSASQTLLNRNLDNFKSLSAVNVYEKEPNTFNGTYLLNSVNIGKLLRLVYRDDNLSSYVKNVMVLPFEPSSYSTSEIEMKIGETSSTDVRGLTSNYGSNNRYLYATFSIPYMNSYVDYEPYTQLEIFIPFKSWITVNICDVENSIINLFYNINYETGEATYILFNYTKDFVISSGACNLGVKVGLNTSNMLELQNQKTQLAINSALSGIASASTLGVGIATGNPFAIMGGVGGLTKTVANGVTQGMQLYNKASTDISSSSAQLVLPNKVYIKTVKTIPFIPETYGKFKGYPTRISANLGDFHGYTMVEEIHLENLSLENINFTPTLAEINELDTLLHEGVILPYEN